MSDSDDDQNIDITYESEDNEVGGEVTVGSSVQFTLASSSVTADTLGIGLEKMSEDTFHRQHEMLADKRAHHNALERKRRDHIKDSFSALRDSVPTISKDKLSRAQVLKKAADYIDFMIRKNQTTRSTLDNLRHQNKGLEQQLVRLENTHGKESGSGAADVASSSAAAEASAASAPQVSESGWRTGAMRSMLQHPVPRQPTAADVLRQAQRIAPLSSSAHDVRTETPQAEADSDESSSSEYDSSSEESDDVEVAPPVRHKRPRIGR